MGSQLGVAALSQRSDWLNDSTEPFFSRGAHPAPPPARTNWTSTSRTAYEPSTSHGPRLFHRASETIGICTHRHVSVMSRPSSMPSANMCSPVIGSTPSSSRRRSSAARARRGRRRTWMDSASSKSCCGSWFSSHSQSLEALKMKRLACPGPPPPSPTSPHKAIQDFTT